MGKGLKYSLIGVGVLAGLLIAAMVLVLVLVDPNDYKDEIAAVVHDKTGRTLTFDGDLSLSVFPWIGVETGKLSLSNAPGFGDKPFAAIDKAAIKVKLLPLLSSKVEVGAIILDKLALNLAKNKQGKTNWDDLVKAGEEAESSGQSAKTETSKESSSDMALAVGGVEINDAMISWSDMQAGKSYVIEDLDLKTGAISPGEPFDMQMSVKLSSSDPALDAQVDMTGQVLSKLSEQVHQVSGLKLKVQAKGPALKDGQAVLQAACDVAADLGAKTYTVKGLNVEVEAKGGMVPAAGVKAGLAADIAADLEAQTAQVANLVLTAANLRATGDVKASGILGKPKAVANLAVAPFNAKEFMKSMGLEPVKTSDPKALSNVGLQTVVEYGPDSVYAKNLSVVLDETKASGTLGVENLKKPAYRATLKVDAVDVDRYLPPASAGDQAKAAEPAKAGKSGDDAQAGLPLDQIRKLDCQAVLDVGRLVVKKMKFTDVHVEVKAKDGLVQVKPFKLSAYGGALASGAVLDARSKVPSANLDMSLAGLDLAPMLTDMQGEAKARGVVDLTANLATKGADAQAMVGSLNGKAGFKMKNGKVSNFNPVMILRNAVSLLRGGQKSDESTKDLADVSGTATFKNGVAYNNDLSAKSPLFRANGKGAVNLAGKTVDYVLNTSLVASTEGQGGADTADLIGITVPISISGSLDDPSVGVDMKELATLLLKSGVRNVEGVVKGVGQGLETIGKELTGGSKESSGSGEESDSKGFRPGKLIKGLFQ